MLKSLVRVWPYLLATVLLTVGLGLLEGFVMIEMTGLFDLALSKQMEQFWGQSIEVMGYGVVLIPLALIVTVSKNLYKQKANEYMKQAYIERVYSKNISEFCHENNAKYLSTLMNDFNTLEQNLIDPIYRIVDGGAMFAAGLWMIWTVNPKLISLGLLLVVINTGLTLWMQKPISEQMTQRSELFEVYTGYIKEALSAFYIIRNNNLQERMSEQFYQKSYTIQHRGYLIDRLLTYVYCMQNTSSSLMVLIVIGATGYLVLQGQGTIGGVLLIIEGIFRVLNPMIIIGKAMPQLFAVKGLVKKIQDTLGSQMTEEETTTRYSLQKGIYFEDVSFGYEPENLILDKVNIHFRPGEKYLIIGPSGGGKSTLLKLMRKYFNPIAGNIWLGDTSLKAIKKETYFNHMSNIDQKVFIFEDTLRNNLTLYKDYIEEELAEAIHLAGLSEFVNSQPAGLERMLYDDGKNVSGGEKSRIAIARALLEKADLILVDEAFSALDPQKAKEIEKSLLALEGVTVIHVSYVIFKEHEKDYDQIFKVKNKQVYEYKEVV